VTTSSNSYDSCAIAVLIPCFNEETTIASVVRSFRACLPTATIYVYDNNSSDNTALVAANAGAVVRLESRQGKGNVVRRMFADIDADVYLLVDGDDTYDASAAPHLVTLLLDGCVDLVNGARLSESTKAYRAGHRFGNWVLTELVRIFFGKQFKDMLSGYKVLSRRYVKSFPAVSSGFETETELTVHALELRMPTAEIITQYRERPEGSNSKLKTFQDGARILRLIAKLVKDERPFMFFSVVSVIALGSALILSAPIIENFIRTGTVPRLPTAVLAVGIVVIAVLTFFVGLILDMVTRARQETKRLCYLTIPPWRSDSAQ
jgi:glycosyltransferase involved in cell wall biosynthesis